MKSRLLLLLSVGAMTAFGCAPSDDASASSSDDLTEGDLAGKPFIEQGMYTGTPGFAKLRGK